MSTLCTDPNDILCEGLNGLKSFLSPLPTTVGEETSTTSSTAVAATSSSATDIVTAAPAPSQTSQPVADPSTTTEIMSSSSVVVIGLSPTGSFITDLPTMFTSVPGSLPTSTSTAAVQSSSTTSSSANTVTASPNVAQGGSSPMALIAGLTSIIPLLAISGLALWYFCHRKRARSRANATIDYGETASGSGIHRTTEIFHAEEKTDGSDDTIQPNLAYGATRHWAEQNRPLSWQHNPPSIHTLTDNRNSFDDTESNFPEPLSPRPVLKQTVQRVSMPRLTEASSVASVSGESSFGASSETSNPYSVRQVVVKGPAPGIAHGRPPSSSSAQTTLKVNLVNVPGEERVNRNTVAARKRVVSDKKSVTSATSLEVPVGLVTDELSSRKSDQSKGLQRQYTLRRSPLAQNPFKDPADEDGSSPMTSKESIESPPLRVKDADTGHETVGHEEMEDPDQELATEKNHPEGTEAETRDDRKEVKKAPLDSSRVSSPERKASTPPMIPAIPGKGHSGKRVSFARNT